MASERTYRPRKIGNAPMIEYLFAQLRKLEDGFTYVEVATLYGCRPATAKTYLSRWEREGIITRVRLRPLANHKRPLMVYMFTDMLKDKLNNTQNSTSDGKT